MSHVEHILDMDNDCLAEIFKRVPFSDFEKLRHVCERFEQVVFDCCRSRYKTWRRMRNPEEYTYSKFSGHNHLANIGPASSCLSKPLEAIENSADYGTDLQWLVLYMRDAVEHLELPHLDCEEFSFLSSYTFPNVKSLKVSFRECNRDLDRAKVLTQIFPKLKSLLIDGYFENCEPITNLQNLTELEVYSPDVIPSKHLEQIFAKLKLRKLRLYCQIQGQYLEGLIEAITNCETLEDIAVNKEWRPYFMQLLDKSTNLQKFAYIDWESDLIFENKLWKDSYTPLANRVISLYSSFSHITINVQDMRNLQKLQVWQIDNCAVRYDNGTPCHFPHLRELHCLRSDTRFVQGLEFILFRGPHKVDISLWNIVARFSTLEKLTIPYAWIKFRYPLSGLLEVLSRQADRKKPLELRCWLTNPEQANIIKDLQYDQHLLKLLVVQRPKREPRWGIPCKEYLTVCLETAES